MDLNLLISAAGWLSEHAPAAWLTEERSTLVVGGDSPLADALFELLFSTACLPGLRIRLIRVCRNAEEREVGLIDRNPEGLQAFAWHAYGEELPGQPLTVRFCEPDDPLWRSGACAWAVTVPEMGEVRAGAVFPLAEIPLLEPMGECWGPADESRVPVLAVARRVHTAYAAGARGGYAEADVSRELYGEQRTEAGSYALRSSLRLAASVPWKLKIAGVRDALALDAALQDRERMAGGRPLREYLAWQEHRSWLAFMTLEGWRCPDEETLQDYLFQGDNDHRDRARRLHPCLCDLRDDWFEGSRSLAACRPQEWNAPLTPERLAEFCRLDRMSLRIHRRCAELVDSPAYRKDMDALLRKLEDAIIQLDNASTGRLIGQLHRVRTALMRLMDNELNSRHPWQRAADELRRSLETEGGTNPAELETARLALERVAAATRPAVERNACRNYKETDNWILDRLPWAIGGGRVETLWKLYAPDQPALNLLSALVFRPARLLLLCEDRRPDAQDMQTCEEILRDHGLADVPVRVRMLPELQSGVLPMGESDVLDVSGSGALQSMILTAPRARRVFYSPRARIYQDAAGAPPFAPLYRPMGAAFTVSEILRLRRQTIRYDRMENEMLGLETDYAALWETSREIQRISLTRRAQFLYANPWHCTIRAIDLATEAAKKPIWRSRGLAPSRRFAFRFSQEQYAVMLQNGAAALLYAMEREGWISGLSLNPDEGSLVCWIYPSRGDREDYSQSEQTLTEILSDASAEGVYALDTEYRGREKPEYVMKEGCPLPFAPERMAEAVMASDPAQVQARIQDLLRRRVCPDEQAAAEGIRGAVTAAVKLGIRALAERGLIISGGQSLQFPSPALRHALDKEGFALEAWLYYTLYLSGCYDDVRSNIRIQTGAEADHVLEKEMDVIAVRGRRMAILSCKDTRHIRASHIGELAQQAEQWGIDAQAVLVCSWPEAALEEEVRETLKYLRHRVHLIDGTRLRQNELNAAVLEILR